MPIKVCAFDAYGTLFDVAAAARAASQEPGGVKLSEHWSRLAAIWREKQLQYTWLRAVTGDHVDFWQVTTDGLDYALEALRLDGDAELRERLLALYRELEPYPEVSGMLAALKSAGMRTAILSNGAPEMLSAAVASAGIGDVIDAVLSVEKVGVFKPDAKVYAMVEEHFGVSREEVMFVSANGWDAACGAAYGFHTLWVNRTGDPAERLPGKPDHVARDLGGAPELASRL